jgi:hypothetical protein
MQPYTAMSGSTLACILLFLLSLRISNVSMALQCFRANHYRARDDSDIY